MCEKSMHVTMFMELFKKQWDIKKKLVKWAINSSDDFNPMKGQISAEIFMAKAGSCYKIIQWMLLINIECNVDPLLEIMWIIKSAVKVLSVGKSLIRALILLYS